MKTMTVGFLLVAATATILFLLIWVLTNNVDAAKGAAAFAVTALPAVSSWLEHSEAKKSSIPGEKIAIRSFEGFSISLPAVVALGTIIALAVLNIGNFFAGFFAAAMRFAASGQEIDEPQKGELLQTAILAYLPILAAGLYFLGKWISWRCARNGILAVVLIAFLTASITKLSDFMILTPTQWHSLNPLHEKTVPALLAVVSYQFAFIAVMGLLGFWRGRRQRTSKYMNYLLSALPEDTRNSLVDLAFDEVRKIVDARRSSQQHSRPANLTVEAPAKIS
jgi:hypothetical protein